MLDAAYKDMLQLYINLMVCTLCFVYEEFLKKREKLVKEVLHS